LQPTSSQSPGAVACRAVLAMMGALLLIGVMVALTPPAVASTYHDGVFRQGAERFCHATSTYTPSHGIRTQIVRSSDGWSNTISSRYRKWTGCTARQMTRTMWCTTKLVDGFSGMCITPKPKATGPSPCRNPRLDVRGVYHPGTGRLEITCVNRA
jgi:hypothetical protein